AARAARRGPRQRRAADAGDRDGLGVPHPCGRPAVAALAVPRAARRRVLHLAARPGRAVPGGDRRRLRRAAVGGPGRAPPGGPAAPGGGVTGRTASPIRLTGPPGPGGPVPWPA